MKSKKTTIYDIAKHCGVSPATVSRVLSGSSYPVSDAAKEAILRTAHETNYVPNLIGKNLKTAKNNDIGVVIPNMSDYYSILLQAIQDVALERDSQIILCNSYRDAKIEEQNVNLLLQKQIKGILIAAIDDNEEILQKIINTSVTVVAMEQGVKADCPRTYFNFEGGAVMAVEHLIELGHRRIGFISSPLTRNSRKELLQGYNTVIKSSGISPDDRDIFIYPFESSRNNDGFYDYEVGMSAAKHFMAQSEHPTAVFCINDLMAIGFIKAIRSMGYSVPEDVAVVGFDNIPFTEMFSPTITTIDQCTYELGHQSASLLFKNMNSASKSLQNRISLRLEPKLIVRESTLGKGMSH